METLAFLDPSFESKAALLLRLSGLFERGWERVPVAVGLGLVSRGSACVGLTAEVKEEEEAEPEEFIEG